MAKKVHAYSLKGVYDQKNRIIAEYDKKTEITSYYSIDDILAEFDGREFSFTVKEEDQVQTVERPDEDEE
jgi:hypothetical protein